jgi:Sec7-like guanine-nucleotide exchange factor
LTVYCEFVATVVYPELNFEECLRKFLILFVLPPEAPQINRIMEIFAETYAKIHPES